MIRKISLRRRLDAVEQKVIEAAHNAPRISTPEEQEHYDVRRAQRFLFLKRVECGEVEDGPPPYEYVRDMLREIRRRREEEEGPLE